MDQVEWHLILGNRFNRKITAAMLNPQGEQIGKRIGITGDPGNRKEWPNRLVVYNRSYVVQKLAREIKGLTHLKADEAVQIFRESLRIAKGQS